MKGRQLATIAAGAALLVAVGTVAAVQFLPKLPQVTVTHAAAGNEPGDKEPAKRVSELDSDAHLAERQARFGEALAKAKNGNGEAALIVGFAYSTGDDVERDDAESEKWLKAAVAANVQGSETILSLLYINTGRASEAVPQLREAAGAGDRVALYLLAILNRDGNGVDKDLAEAERLFRLSAEKGFSAAKFELGGLLYTTGDQPQGFRYLASAAEDGVPEAWTELGVAYLLGKMVPNDLDKAFELFSKAAEYGTAKAEDLLGRYYEYGLIRVEQDYYRAYVLYRRATLHGSKLGEPDATALAPKLSADELKRAEEEARNFHPIPPEIPR